MAIRKITVSELIDELDNFPLFDVRSPSEYHHAHIPGAHSLPLFTDDERAVVGTAYKQKGKKIAVKNGLEFFAPKMKFIIEQVESLYKAFKKQDVPLVVNCWRGGMRSAGVAWLLDLYGFEVYQLVGGYKAFRKWTLEQFEKPYEISILGGYTGSAKTETLLQLRNEGVSVIDLEGIAIHKGSAFGGIGLPPQPSQEMFENKLALELYFKDNRHFWLEDESQRIGILNIPHALWNTMRKSKITFIDIPFNDRLQYILKHYGKLDKERLIGAVVRIQKRFGPNETKTTLNLLLEDKTEEAFELLLHYYDREYFKSLQKRENLDSLLKKIAADKVDPEDNAKIIKESI